MILPKTQVITPYDPDDHQHQYKNPSHTAGWSLISPINHKILGSPFDCFLVFILFHGIIFCTKRNTKSDQGRFPQIFQHIHNLSTSNPQKVVSTITQCGRQYYPWWLLTLPIVVSDVTLGGQPHYPFVLEPLISLAFRHLPNKIIQQDNLSLYLLKINNILTNNTPV